MSLMRRTVTNEAEWHYETRDLAYLIINYTYGDGDNRLRQRRRSQ